MDKEKYGCFIYLHILLQIKLNILLIILEVSCKNSNSYNSESTRTSTAKNTTRKIGNIVLKLIALFLWWIKKNSGCFFFDIFCDTVNCASILYIIIISRRFKKYCNEIMSLVSNLNIWHVMSLLINLQIKKNSLLHVIDWKLDLKLFKFSV